MKVLILLLVLLLSNMLFAQQYPVLTTTSLADSEHSTDSAKRGNYAMDTENERQQYVGLWEYNQNGVLFQLKIEMVDQAILLRNSPNGIRYSYTDEVILKYRLVKNGVELFNNLNAINVTNEIAYGYKLGHEDFLGARMKDFTRNVFGHFEIRNITPFQPNVTPKITFEMILANYHKLNPNSFYQDGQPLFSIPLGPLEMVKIN